jgi:uncharacterized membrane protein
MIEFLQGKWLKHPLHPALVHIPTALWPAALVFDLFAVFRGGSVFVQVSFLAILTGLLVVLLAAPTGYADWTGIRREKPAWRIGLIHMSINLVVTVLQVINLALRWGTWQTASTVSTAPLLLSATAVILLAVSGYLGGRMVYAYGINVARLSKKKWRQIAAEGGAALPPQKGDKE